MLQLHHRDKKLFIDDDGRFVLDQQAKLKYLALLPNKVYFSVLLSQILVLFVFRY